MDDLKCDISGVRKKILLHAAEISPLIKERTIGPDIRDVLEQSTSYEKASKPVKLETTSPGTTVNINSFGYIENNMNSLVISEVEYYVKSPQNQVVYD